MKRTHYEAEHEAFADAVRTFLDKELVPHFLDWERDGITPREVFTAAGRNGFLGMAVPEQYGGGGIDDFRFNQAIDEQIALAGVTGSGLGISLHNDTCLPYFLSYANEEQRQRWLPGIVSGDLITAVAMTEPGAGSDLSAIRTSAVRSSAASDDGGDHYVVNGAKTFITNGINADLVITAARTGEHRHKGISLLVLERGMPGFERGRNLAKVGLHSQDTAELSFNDVRVPVANLLGVENEGFLQLVRKLPQERLSIAVGALAEARAAFNHTLSYVKERTAFGTTIGSFQNSKFVLAEIATEIDVTQSFVDDCVIALNAGELSAEDAAKAKWWASELQGRVVDRCVQLHGGYGFMLEYPIARAFCDARVTRIYGGATEIMKEVIGRSLGL
ncbi:MAG: acyl-CoA dehydrogenase family protein [Actinomycetota bacterium]